MEQKPISILFAAGDPSGDEHAAPVIRRLRTLLPQVHTFGIGGPCMQQEGFEQLLPFEPFNRMGFAEVFSQLPFFLHAKSYLVKQLASLRPAALVCVDYPGLNIPLMKAARRLGVPVVWYIVPQVWAWKEKRAAVLGANASHIAVVFPFEEEYFRHYAAPVSFVGHPLVELLDRRRPASRAALRPFPATHTSVRLALVPGSRRQEIVRMLPAMINAAVVLKKRYPALTVKVSMRPGLGRDLFGAPVARFGSLFPGAIETSEEPLFDLVGKCDCAIVTSGTATLQTALCGVPLVVAYRTSALSFSLMKSMVKLPYIGLPNIVAGERIVPECIQNDVTGERLAAEIASFLESKERYETANRRLIALRDRLGGRRPSEEVAAIIRNIVAEGQPKK
ncbi:MAG TPA: lipid-A-disaccharide synthase [Chitinivibrionales bacterium]|jgi:lipid-A-disaccharide synthase|nr:lipid-A-disaccharide synthase [Chitinivibrionales bacterium]